MGRPCKLVEASTGHSSPDMKRSRAVARDAIGYDDISLTPPKKLRGDDLACAYWRQTVKLMRTRPKWVWCRLDVDCICDYCLTMADVDRSRQQRTWYLEQAEQYEGRSKREWLKAAEKLDVTVRQTVTLAQALRHALYLNPMARAGLVPPEEQPDEGCEIVELFG